jgi:hypothetical protein
VSGFKILEATLHEEFYTGKNSSAHLSCEILSSLAVDIVQPSITNRSEILAGIH